MILHSAGLVGIAPHDLTYYEVATMASARQRWESVLHARLLCMLHNIHAGKGARSKTPADFDPLSSARTKPKRKISADEMWAVLFGGRTK